MHYATAFAMAGGEAAARDAARRIGFATIAVATADGPLLAYAPMIATGTGDLRFHLATRNALVPHLDGARVVASWIGPHGYVSPDWYSRPHEEVPTWNYVAVEARGVCRRLDAAGLRETVEALSDEFEARLAPKPIWKLGKMEPRRADAVLKAIVGFEIAVEAVEGVHKANQNKPLADRRGVVAALEALGEFERARMVPTDD